MSGVWLTCCSLPGSAIPIFGSFAENGSWAIFGAILGAVLSVLIAVWLDVSGVLEKLRESRRRQQAKRARERKEREAQESDGQPSFDDWSSLERPRKPAGAGTKTVEPWSPGEDDLPAKGASSFRLALSSLHDFFIHLTRAIKDLLALTLSIPWATGFYLLLVSGVLWLDSLLLRLGCSDETAASAVLADWVLTVLTGAWILTGLRTRKRTALARVTQTALLVLLIAACLFLAVDTENLLYAGGCLAVGTWAYAKLFP